jgi:4-carboxymuconolactone decarboxylase
MTERKLPADIDPESGYRLPHPKREELDGDAKKIYDAHADPKGGSHAGLRGPGGIRLHSPRLAVLNSPLSQYMRHEAGIPLKVRELAILATARELDSQFEWTAHEPVALRVGVPQSTVDIVKYRKPTAGLPDEEAVVIEFARELFGRRRVSSETFARALKLFGRRMLVDIVNTMGSYSCTAALLTAFDIQLHPGKEPLLPIP